MPAFGAPFMAEAMDPIKKSGKWIHYVMPFLEKNNNGTQGNNKITTPKKDGEQRREQLCQQGSCRCPDGSYKVHRFNTAASQRLSSIVKSSLVFCFFSCFDFLSSSTYTSADFFCFLWETRLEPGITFCYFNRLRRNDTFPFSINFRGQALPGDDWLGSILLA